MQISTAPLFRPSTFAILGLIMSAMAWLFPDIGGLNRGYDVAARFTFQSVLLLADWWLLIFVGFRVGEVVGRRLFKRLIFARHIDRLDSRRVFIIYTLMAAFGIGLTYAKIFSSLSLAEALIYLAGGRGNQLKAALYDEYSAGFVSLRYLVAYSAALAAYRFVVYRKWDVFYLLNGILLATSALLSSRLIFVSTVLISLFLILGRVRKIRVRFLRIATGGFVVFLILASLNASRNSNYYARDNLYFWGAGVSSIVAYLGSPFQVAIGTANEISAISGTNDETYRNFVDVDETLNTNSAFVDLTEAFGTYSWPYIVLLTFAAGLLFSCLSNYGNSVFLLPCAAILYASSELWRLDLFRQGIFQTWLGAGLAVPVLVGYLPRLRIFPQVRGDLELTNLGPRGGVVGK